MSRNTRGNKRGRGNTQQGRQAKNLRRPEEIPARIQPKVTLNTLQNRRMISHRTIDWSTIDMLGMRGDFEAWLTPDWRRFFNIRTPAYRSLVEEFFSTYRMDVRMGSTTATAMTFRLGGRTHTLSIAEFGIHMGLYTEEEVLTEEFTQGVVTWPSNVNSNSFWQNYHIGAGEHYNNTKQSAITNPAHRILSRVIAESICNRGNCQNNATTADLFYLFCMVTGRRCNIARCLAIYLYEKGHGKERGTIAGGAFVCHLAQQLGVANLQQLENSEGSEAGVGLFDMRALINIGICNSNGVLAAPGNDNEGNDDEDDPEVQHERVVEQQPPPPVQTEDPYSMQSIARQLELLQDSQLNFYSLYREDQRMIDSRFDRVSYHQERYQPYMDHWAQREAEIMGQPLPPYTPPEIFIPPHRQGGFYYPPQQSRGDTGPSGSVPFEPPVFGTYASEEGTPSVFPNPHDMD